jgi:hypothetical protein
MGLGLQLRERFRKKRAWLILANSYLAHMLTYRNPDAYSSLALGMR